MRASRKLFNPFPKYLQLREIIRRRMLTEYELGGRLPTEMAFCEEFGVARETIREALRDFETEGLIKRQRAQGTFLIKRPDANTDLRLTGMTEDFSALKLDTYAKVLKAEEIVAPSEAAQMKIEGDRLYYICRLRYFDGAPLSLNDAFLPRDVGSSLGKLDLSNTSIVREIEDTLKIECYEERAQIEATAADAALARQLDISVGDPLLLLSRFFVRNDRTPLIMFRAYYRADRYYYTLNMSDRKASPAFAHYRT